jgi:hypothetical protein
MAQNIEDTCRKTHEQIARHQAAIERLRHDRSSYEGTSQYSRVGDEIADFDEKIRQHEESILNLQELLQFNGC